MRSRNIKIVCVCVCVCVCILYIYILYMYIKVFAPFLFFYLFFCHICHTKKIQIIKQILILHKDNASKYKMQFLNEPRTTSKELQASIAFNNKKETGQKQHPWESSKAKATADQKEHKGSSHICQKIS